MQETIKNRTIFCRDNLEVLRRIDTETIDLIYLDPPFNTNEEYTAPIGTTAEGASFRDIFEEEDVKDEWRKQIAYKYPSLADYIDGIGGIGNRRAQYYLCYMAVRLIEMRRVLKNTGSIYLHCDKAMSHYLKLLMDCVFGLSNFRNEIVWLYGKMANTTKNYRQNHDNILFYTKTDKYTFNIIKKEESEYKNRWSNFVRENKIHYGDVKRQKRQNDYESCKESRARVGGEVVR